MANPPLLSPLRYPGSKRRLANYVKNCLELNKLRPSIYIEPFVGGGSVVLQLLQNDLVEKVILIDLDPWIASFWKTVFFDSEWLIEKIKTEDITLDNWLLLKESKPRTIRDQAWTCFYLNRTSFSGILEQRAGPLGGLTQKSEYKIDCRFPRKTLIERIQTISSFRNKIVAIWPISWKGGLEKIRQKQETGILPTDNLFFYLDPPFFEKADALYRFYFEHDDHVRLRDSLINLQDKWILSYDSADQVEALYGHAIRSNMNGTKKHHIELLYSISVMQERKKGKEVILSNLENLPSLEDGSNK